LLQFITGHGSTAESSIKRSGHALELRDRDTPGPKGATKNTQTDVEADNESQEFILPKGMIRRQVDVQIDYALAEGNRPKDQNQKLDSFA
jgi:hypothetical protein